MSCSSDLRRCGQLGSRALAPGFCAAPDSGTTASLHPPEHAEGLERHAASRCTLGAGRGSDCARLGRSGRCGHHRAPRRRLEVAPRMRVYLPEPHASRVCTSRGRPANWGGTGAGRLPGPAAARSAVEAGAREQPQSILPQQAFADRLAGGDDAGHLPIRKPAPDSGAGRGRRWLPLTLRE